MGDRSRNESEDRPAWTISAFCRPAASSGSTFSSAVTPHIRLVSPTLIVEAPRGDLSGTDADRLAACDDQEACDFAATLGDPEQLLSDDRLSEIPGISVPGACAEHIPDPARWVWDMLGTDGSATPHTTGRPRGTGSCERVSPSRS